MHLRSDAPGAARRLFTDDHEGWPVNQAFAAFITFGPTGSTINPLSSPGDKADEVFAQNG